MNLLAGIALGLLVGLLLGLSASPVVASTVASLLAVVVTFFGFGGSVGPVAVEASASRVVGFSLAMAFAVVGGILLRAHGTLSPSVSDRVAEWTQAGYPPERARDLAIFQILGIAPAGSAAPASGTPTAGSGLLFAEEGAGDCGALTADRFSSPQDRLRAMINTGGVWAALKSLKAPDDPERLGPMLDAAWLVACGKAEPVP
ncbi:MAG: hypothetical protein GC201_00300 [Alphaproteobacteria bacterium]|nr:hypothetical protein [Alphaproteobacteria bacterium]